MLGRELCVCRSGLPKDVCPCGRRKFTDPSVQTIREITRWADEQTRKALERTERYGEVLRESLGVSRPLERRTTLRRSVTGFTSSNPTRPSLRFSEISYGRRWERLGGTLKGERTPRSVIQSSSGTTTSWGRYQRASATPPDRSVLMSTPSYWRMGA